jgi:hypothetical protein
MNSTRMPANGLCFGLALMSLACSGSAGKGGAGGGGGTGGIGAIAGSNQSGGVGGATAGASGGTGAVGGSSQSGGAGGATAGAGGGSGGIGGGGQNGGIDGGVPTLELPKCVSDLLAACPTTGSCVRSENDAGQVDMCYGVDGGAGGGGGVRTVFTPSHDPAMDCGFTGAGTTVVSKADGSPCYSFEAHEPQTMDCETHTWTWRDASGQVVATGSLTFVPHLTSQITCAVGGAKTTCTERAQSPSTSCCNVSASGLSCQAGAQPSTCVAGACP